MITDNIADTLTRIRNALSSRKNSVLVIYSSFIARIILLLYNIGYFKNIRIIKNGIKRYIVIELKYDKDGNSIITGIKRASKPGLRLYCKKNKLPIIYNGTGTAIISTSCGLLTTYRAKKQDIGGEIICIIW